ncbi:MAG: hypothetical protein LBT78_01920, partial [Tannerella sp.]|nr:hypothetical protein [Tannerella sp.]
RRPKIIFMVDCQNVTVENIKLRNSAFWTAHFLQCDGVTLSNLDIYGHANWNNDGLDIDSKNVLVENCTVDVDDDAVCLKSDLASVCENITVKNCTIKSNCNAIKFGTSSYGGFKNVDISNCSVSKASEDNHRHWQTAQAWAYVGQPSAAISGIAVESVDGGILEDVTISDITITDVMAPIFIRLGDRHRKYYQGNISVLKNVTIRDITAKGVSRLASSITAVEGTYAENVTIKNVNITVPGGGTLANIGELVSENIANYPEATMFGKALPAYGFYVRHIKNITFDNVTVNKIASDVRPLFYCDDVDNATLTGSRPPGSADNEFLRQKNCNNITVNGVLYEGGVIGGSGGDPNEGTLVVGANTYTTYNYDGVVWMVTNSKEGTPTATTYTGHTAGENGYYYNSTDKLTACPSGWHLPTIAEALALQAIVRSDVTADNVKWWKQSAYGACAGRNSGTLPNGSWGQWGTTGIWRLGSGKLSNPDDETHVFSTLTNYPDSDVDPNHDPVTHFIVEESVNDTQSNRARWFSVRCVQD